MGCLACCNTKEIFGDSGLPSTRRTKSRLSQIRFLRSQAHQHSLPTAASEDHSQILPGASAGLQNAGQAASEGSSMSNVKRQEPVQHTAAVQAIRPGGVDTACRSQLVQPGAAGCQAVSPVIAVTKDHLPLSPPNPARLQILSPLVGGEMSAPRGTTHNTGAESPPTGNDSRQLVRKNADVKKTVSQSHKRVRSTAASSSQIKLTRSTQAQTPLLKKGQKEPQPTSKAQQVRTGRLLAGEGRDPRERAAEAARAETPEPRAGVRQHSTAASGSQVQSLDLIRPRIAPSDVGLKNQNSCDSSQPESTGNLAKENGKDCRGRKRLTAGAESEKAGQTNQQQSFGAIASQVQAAGPAGAQTIPTSARGSIPILSRRSSSSSEESTTSSGESSTSVEESFILIFSGSTRYSDWLAVDANGVQFRPKPRGDARLMPRPHPPDWVRKCDGKFGIGIETEFLLRAYDAAHKAGTKVDFAECLQDNHNANVEIIHPPLRNETVFPDPDPKYQGDEWSLVNDDTVETDREPWAIEMTSPIFIADPGSPWRGHVQATWRFLKRHYQVIEHTYYGTHIHVSAEGGYTLQEMKQIAQCVIHFEPAFDALVPSCRRGGNNIFGKSNWVDGECFAKANRSRAQSIGYIASIDNLGAFLTAMNPDGDKKFAWNFESIRKYWTIEFRQPPVCTRVDQVLSWAELALSFIQSSIRYGHFEQLLRVPSTIGGLRWFLEQSNVPTINQHGRLERFWKHSGGRNRNRNDFVPATGPLGFYSEEEQLNLDKLIEADTRQIRIHAQEAQAPYWR